MAGSIARVRWWNFALLGKWVDCKTREPNRSTRVARGKEEGDVVDRPADPRLLLLETSGRVGQVALAHGESLLGLRRLDETRRHARDLAPAVRDLLAEHGWRPRDLHAVVVSRGPGSYTGLRVGVMSAKALAYATGCTLLAPDTFAAIAVQTPAAAQRLDVLADAQQDRVYVQRFRRSGEGVWAPETALAIQTVTQW